MKMRYLGQIFIRTGLIGLLAIPAMTQARTDEAGFQSNATAFELSHDSTALNKQLALDRFPAIVDLSQATNQCPIIDSNRANSTRYLGR
jgi:hypothetical protein